jgi:hypothetical protein
MIAYNKPIQRKTYNEKFANDNLHGKQTCSHYLKISSIFRDRFYEGSKPSSRQENYDILTNNIPEHWFHHIKNPLSTSNKKYQNFPAKIRAYNIIIPNVDLYMGEYIKRTFKYQCLNKSEEGYNSFIEEKTQALYANVKQHYINTLVEAGQVAPEEAKEVPLPEELEADFMSDFVDQIADKGQSVLEYLEHDKKLGETFKECFYDWLAIGECHTFKNVVRNDVIYERVNPLTFKTDFSEDTKYGEDGNYTVRRKIVSLGDIIDNAYDEISNKDIERLEKQIGEIPAESGPNSIDSDKTYLYHVTWKSIRIKYILSYIDELGQPAEMEVAEGYKADKELGEKIEELSLNEWWESSFIPLADEEKDTQPLSSDNKYGVNPGIYFRVRPIPVQRGSLNNLASCKGLYNSIYFKNENSHNTSVVDLGKPYLIMFIILNYKIELTIAKSKGKITVFDKNSIPRHEGWDEETFFYYTEALGYSLIDRNQTGADKSFNQYQVLDMGLFGDISNLISVKDSVKSDYDELLGISRQRKGNVAASETATGTTAATMNSSVISEYLFNKFDDFKVTEYEGLLDMARYAYAEGKKGMYIGNDGSSRLLSLVGGDFEGTELGIAISNSIKDTEKLITFKQYAQAFAQNGSTPSTVGKIVQSDSLIQVTKILEKIEADQMKQQQAAAKSEQEAEQARMATEREFEEYKSMLNTNEMEALQDRLDNREYIKGDVELTKSTNEELSANLDSTIEDVENRTTERIKQQNERSKIDNEKSSKRRELDLKEKEINVKEKDSENKLKIARENKNRHDKK